MRMRLGLVAGFAAGVYVATVAQRRSRQRDQQGPAKNKRTVSQAALDAAAQKAKAALDLGVTKARNAVAAKLADPGPQPPPPAIPGPSGQQHNGGRPTSSPTPP